MHLPTRLPHPSKLLPSRLAPCTTYPPRRSLLTSAIGCSPPSTTTPTIPITTTATSTPTSITAPTRTSIAIPTTTTATTKTPKPRKTTPHPYPSLATFLQRQQVLALWRSVLRTLRRMPAGPTRAEWRGYARAEIERQRGVQDAAKVRYLLARGREEVGVVGGWVGR